MSAGSVKANKRKRDFLWFVDILVAGIASLSVTYALIPALDRGTDLAILQVIGRNWVEGSRTHYFYGYPPFIAPLCAPLALISFEYLRLAWLVVNLIAAGLCVSFVVRLAGSAWTPRLILYLSAFFLSWASFRVTLRNGQVVLVIMTLVLGSLLARMKKREYLAGVLLGLSLCKYPLSAPFFLYFVWKKESKIWLTALLAPLVLSLAYSLHSGVELTESARHYSRGISRASSVSEKIELANTLGIKPLVTVASGGNRLTSFVVSSFLALAAMIGMGIVFRQRPNDDFCHFATLSLFVLWSVYHRAYDGVILLLPAALTISWLAGLRRADDVAGESKPQSPIRSPTVWAVNAQGRLRGIAIAVLLGLAVIGLNPSGYLRDSLGRIVHLDFSPYLGFVMLHVERVVVFILFWVLLFVLWRREHQLPRRSQI